MDNIKISVILPVYNAEKTISRTITSIINQNYDNYELIVINDGSTDNSAKICKGFLEKNPKIKYIELENNGVSNARNCGIKNSTGDYIMFIDSDDEYTSIALQTVIEKLQEDTTLELIAFSYERIHINTNKVKIMHTNNIEIKEGNNKNIFIEKLQRQCLFNQIWNKVFKRDVLNGSSVEFDVTVSSGEDYKFNIQYIDLIKNAIYIDKVLYKYYSGVEGLSLKTGPEKIYVKIRNLNEHKKLYEKMNYDITYIDNSYVYTCLSGLTAMKVKDNSKKTTEYFRKYINNEDIRKELNEIRKRSKSLKIKLCIRILTIKHVFILKAVVNVLSITRIIYRKIRLG